MVVPNNNLVHFEGGGHQYYQGVRGFPDLQTSIYRRPNHEKEN